MWTNHELAQAHTKLSMEWIKYSHKSRHILISIHTFSSLSPLNRISTQNKTLKTSQTKHTAAIFFFYVIRSVTRLQEVLVTRFFWWGLGFDSLVTRKKEGFLVLIRSSCLWSAFFLFSLIDSRYHLIFVFSFVLISLNCAQPVLKTL